MDISLAGLGGNSPLGTPNTSSESGLGFGGSQFSEMFSKIQSKLAAQQTEDSASNSVKELLDAKVKAHKSEHPDGVIHFLKEIMGLLEDIAVQDKLKLDKTQIYKIQTISTTFINIQSSTTTSKEVIHESAFIAIASIGRTLSDVQFTDLLNMLKPAEEANAPEKLVNLVEETPPINPDPLTASAPSISA